MNSDKAIDLSRSFEPPWNQVEVPARVLEVPSMLSDRERGLLYWLAGRYFSFAGRIVDAGCFLGGSTVALAAGLQDRPGPPAHGVIATYDLFRVTSYLAKTYGPDLPDPEVGASFRPAFDKHLAPWIRFVEVHEGDICTLGWSGEPIEILFLDIVKSWRINDVVVGQFFPALIPGRSLILQQDYLWGGQPWVHITMELLAAHVRILDWMANGTVVYLVSSPFPDHLLRTRLREDLSHDELRVLMDQAVSRWTGEERGLVELARAMLWAELSGSAVGRKEFDQVRRSYSDSSRVRYFSQILAEMMSW